MFNSDFDREFEQREKRFNLTFNIAWIAIILFVIIGGSVAQYNSLVDKNSKVEQYYSVIETTLQRRNDLIPNVVNSVKGYMAHEEKLLTEITNARKEIGKAEIENGSNLDSSISKLIALAESNPELKANENVNALIIELEGTENRILVARQDYIKAVSEYNATIRKFPTSVFAKIFGFKEIQIFQASPESNTVPNVDLK
jgi:LemA family protein